MDADLRCPYCAEPIRPEAIRCPHCRSRLAALDPARWHRDLPDRRVAGVAAAVAQSLGVSTAAVRVGFIAASFFHLLGPVLYGALWLLMPFTPGGPSPLERGVVHAKESLARFTSRTDEPAVPGGPSA